MAHQMSSGSAQDRSRRLVMPYSDEAEQSVLGSALYNKEYLANAVAELKVTDFYVQRNQVVFTAILDLVSRQEPVDILTVTDRLEIKEELAAAGGAEYVISLPDKTPIMQNQAHYIKVVRQHAQRRALILALRKIIDLAYTSGEDVEDLINLAADRIYNIRESRDLSGFSILGDVLNRKINELHELAQGKRPKLIQTGYPSIDRILGGLRPGGLYILAARPGIGKTSLALNIAHLAAKREESHVGIFSLEMSKEEVGMRILVGQSQIPADRMEKLKVKDDDWEEISKALITLYTKPIYIDDRSATNVVEMQARCRQLQIKDRLDFVIVDYLQLMSSGGRTSRSENRQQEIAEISRMLKIMAKELEVPVLALSQLSRESERRSNRRPMLIDLRESGAIEQDADVVMFLHDENANTDEPRPDVYEIELIIAKNRHGATGSVHLAWKPVLTSFFDTTEIPPPEEAPL
ncbi:MAG TPA: replicative DNA helicase [Clostridiaceae bacterium]|nr:replicative DNA helicase [Clostridiaceae bacterium]